jgi:hypothetical protein
MSRSVPPLEKADKTPIASLLNPVTTPATTLPKAVTTLTRPGMEPVSRPAAPMKTPDRMPDKTGPKSATTRTTAGPEPATTRTSIGQKATSATGWTLRQLGGGKRQVEPETLSKAHEFKSLLEYPGETMAAANPPRHPATAPEISEGVS